MTYDISDMSYEIFLRKAVCHMVCHDIQYVMTAYKILMTIILEATLPRILLETDEKTKQIEDMSSYVILAK